MHVIQLILMIKQEFESVLTMPHIFNVESYCRENCDIVGHEEEQPIIGPRDLRYRAPASQFRSLFQTFLLVRVT